MKSTWQSLSGKFEALNKRERWMVACALFTVVFAAINSLLISPVLSRNNVLSNEIAADQAQIQSLTEQISAYANQTVIDPDAQNKQRISDLNRQLKTLDTQLNGLQSTLISPEEMPDLLRSLLKKNGKLKLIELKTLAPQNILETNLEDKSAVAANAAPTEGNANQVANQQAPALFKHGVEITVEGRYLDLLNYVSDLEQMPWHVLWSKAALNEEQPSPNIWPTNRLKLTVYTLNLDKDWLSI